MAPQFDECRGARHRRTTHERHEHSPIAPGDELTVSPLGRAFLDALRQDERYRDLIDDPYGTGGGPAAA